MSTYSMPNDGDFSSFGDTLPANDGQVRDRAADRYGEYFGRRKEVYKHNTDWLISNVSWSEDSRRLALTSYVERYENSVQIVALQEDDREQDLKPICTFDHPYPATKILWSPQQSSSSQLLATSADYLRLWRLDDANPNNSTHSLGSSEGNKNSVKLERLMSTSQAPLTSFDWTSDSKLIITSNYDSTCNLWDVEMGLSIRNFDKESLSIRKDQRVYDVSWSNRVTGREEIVFCEDNFVRLLDIRQPSCSVVLFEMDRQTRSSGASSFVRVSCSKQDDNLAATFTDSSGLVLIIDLRKPGGIPCQLKHSSVVNSVSWSPKSYRGICSGGDDQQALIWQVPDVPEQPTDPLLAYRADGKINSVSWAPSNVFIAIGYRNSLELLRV